jgi:hypothetical protein
MMIDEGNFLVPGKEKGIRPGKLLLYIGQDTQTL